MNKQILAAIIVLAVAVVWARKSFAISASATTAGVDRDSRAGVSPVTGAAHETPSSTPRVTVGVRPRVQVSAVAFQQQHLLRPFNNPDSARAAYTAPLRTDYTPSSRATVY